MIRRVVWPVLCLLALSPVGCSVLSHEASAEDIDKAAALFFQRLGNEQYDVIYNDSSTMFKQNQPLQTVIEKLKQLVEHGKVVEFQRLSMTFQGKGESRIASPVYTVTFDRAGAGGEATLNFQDQSGEWKLAGFAYKPRL